MLKKTCASCLLASFVFSSLFAQEKTAKLSEETIASANVIELSESQDFSEIQLNDEETNTSETSKKKLSKKSNPLIIINVGKEKAFDSKAAEPKTQPKTKKTAEKVSDSTKQVDSELGYFSVGLGPFPFPLPAFGLGFRKQVNNFGLDVSAQVSTLVFVTQVKTSLLYQYFPKPNLDSEFYIGVGPALSGLFGAYGCKSEFLISPELALGRQYKTKTDNTRFIEMRVNFPSYVPASRHNKVMWMPLVMFNYGMGF